MLRHKIFFDGFGAVDRTVEKREIVPRFKAPVRVEYSRDGDMTNIVNVVQRATNVELLAAVASGKSTRIPLKISQAMGRLVIHTIPFHIAARYLGSYLATTQEGDRITYMDDIEADVPQHGVVLMTNAFFHARLARDAFAGIQNAILYLDEVHESDAATAVIREIAPALRMFSCVIKATATSAPGVALPPKLPGSRVTKTYADCSPSTWSSGDRGKPWSAAMIQGNVMIALDRVETRERLRQEYVNHGFDVRVCTSNVDYSYFEETIRRLKDPNGGIVVVLSDYAYRSSVTIPNLSFLIESGEVAVPMVEDGVPVIRYRPAYDFETQQFFGRGSRLPGEQVICWRSTKPSPMYMCDLESLEGDAANLLYRLMGFRPPVNLSVFNYYDGDVPIDIAAAMASDHPLALCPSESKVPWVNGDQCVLDEKRKASYQYELKRRGRPTVMSYYTDGGVERPVTPPPPVPVNHAVTRVDIDAMREYRQSRDSSPSLDTVFTLKSELPDNLSVLEDGEYQAFAKPKRVAKRVLEERAAAAAAAQEKANLEAANSGITDLSESKPVVEEPVRPVRQATTMVKRFEGAVRADKGIHHTVKHRQEVGITVAVRDEDLGNYVYYHGMDNAPDQSEAFWCGIRSVLQFSDRPESRVNAKGLSASERLYAMRALVDEYNNQTAVAMGIQRLFAEVSGRPPDEWQDLVNHDDLTQTIEWMTSECTSAQARTRLCRDVMPLFMDYAIDMIPPALDLEQRVMREMMQKFETAAVKKDPDKAYDYMQLLNRRNIRVAPKRNRTLFGN